jgi:hypothetical protein
MTIKDKYGIPADTWTRMIRDGILSCRIATAEEIITCYRKHTQSGMSHTKAIISTSVDMRCSETWVYKTVKKFM